MVTDEMGFDIRRRLLRHLPLVQCLYRSQTCHVAGGLAMAQGLAS